MPHWSIFIMTALNPCQIKFQPPSNLSAGASLFIFFHSSCWFVVYIALCPATSLALCCKTCLILLPFKSFCLGVVGKSSLGCMQSFCGLHWLHPDSSAGTHALLQVVELSQSLAGQAAVMWTVRRGPGGKEQVADCRSWGLQSYNFEESSSFHNHVSLEEDLQDPKRSTAPWHLSAAWGEMLRQRTCWATQTLDPQASPFLNHPHFTAVEDWHALSAAPPPSSCLQGSCHCRFLSIWRTSYSIFFVFTRAGLLATNS